MAFTSALRDHVWFVQGTADGDNGLIANSPPSEQKWRTVRFLPGGAAATVTVERIKEDGTTEVIWESAGGGSTIPQESRLDVRATKGFKVTFPSVAAGTSKLYLYGALDGAIGR